MNTHLLKRIYVTVFLLWPLAGTSVAADAVTYFDKPPTAHQLSEAFKTASRSRTSSFKGRSIEWNAAAAASPAAGTAALASGAANADDNASGSAVAVPVNFDFGSSQITTQSMPYIDAIASALKVDPSLRLTVEGHTDASGDANRNLVLSWERAVTVYRTLVVKYQIDPNRLRPEGKGIQEPLQGKSPVDGVNRRVQFRPIQ